MQRPRPRPLLSPWPRLWPLAAVAAVLLFVVVVGAWRCVVVIAGVVVTGGWWVAVVLGLVVVVADLGFVDCR